MRISNIFLFGILLITCGFWSALNAQECSVWVVENPPPQHDNGAAQADVDELRARGIEPVRVKNIEELYDKVRQKLADDGCSCLKDLFILGHGSPGHLTIGAGMGEGSPDNYINGNEASWSVYLGDLMLDKGCASPTPRTIFLLGCNAGACDDGSTKLHHVAQITGSFVVAPVDIIYGGGNFDYLNNKRDRLQHGSPLDTERPACILPGEQKVEEKKKSVGTKYFCPCDNTYYETASECSDGCTVTLSCFNNICNTVYQNNTWNQYCGNPALAGTIFSAAMSNDMNQDRMYSKKAVKKMKMPNNAPNSLSGWDEYGISGPCVIKDKSGYHMWFQGWDAEDITRIGYAFSHYGFDWVKHMANPVLSEGPAGSWDDEGVYNACVIKDGDTWKMWYHGFSEYSRIGYATSPDGINWSKHPDNPVLDLGEGEQWDYYGVGEPSVIKEGDTYKMWYSGYDGWYWLTGYATSSDGIHWQKYEGNPVLRVSEFGIWDDGYITNPCVVKANGNYHMWYGGYDWYVETDRIGYAVSSDGMSWTKSDENPVIDRVLGEKWNNTGINFPSVIYNPNEDIFEIWYRGVDDSSRYHIGYASSTLADYATGIKSSANPPIIPDQFVLHQNYPNPFNSSTIITYDVPKAVHIKIAIYNSLGQEIRTLVDQKKEPGSYRIEITALSDNGSTLASGLYFVKMSGQGFKDRIKMIHLK